MARLESHYLPTAQSVQKNVNHDGMTDTGNYFGKSFLNWHCLNLAFTKRSSPQLEFKYWVVKKTDDSDLALKKKMWRLLHFYFIFGHLMRNFLNLICSTPKVTWQFQMRIYNRGYVLVCPHFTCQDRSSKWPILKKLIRKFANFRHPKVRHFLNNKLELG